MQYKSFSLKAAQHFLDDVAKLKLEALRTGDENLNKLANQRIKTFTLVTMPGNAATSAVKSLARGRAPSLMAMAESMVKGPMGVVGDAGLLPVDIAAAHFGNHPLQDWADIPAASVPLGAAENVARGISSGDPPQGLSHSCRVCLQSASRTSRAPRKASEHPKV